MVPHRIAAKPGVRWAAVGEQTADAALVDGPFSVTMRVTFDDSGLLRSSRFEARGMGGRQEERVDALGGVLVRLRHARRNARAPVGRGSLGPAAGAQEPYWRGAVGAITYRT